MSAIHQAITNAMADINPIAKDKKNEQQGFKFRGIDQVMNELNPILTRYKIFIYPEVINAERDERQTGNGKTLIYSILTVKYHFATEDGSEVCATVVGEGMDSGDKASNKAMAVAFKYACLQMFCIPTEDMPDPDTDTPPPSNPKGTKTEGTKPPDPPKQKDRQQELKNEAWELIKKLPKDQQSMWIESCKGANESILNEVITEVHAILASLDEAGIKEPDKELEIF